MITSISGTLTTVGLDWVEVTIGGVGLHVNVPASLIEQVGQVGNTAKLFTSLQVKENSLTLYGFPTSDGRQAFETLLTVNGVGPGLALAILSKMAPEILAMAVATEDAAEFKAVPGVGSRIAQRIVMELKDKLEVEMTGESAGPADADLIEALTPLGYTRAEVMEAAASLPRDEPLDFEDKVRLALQFLASQ